MARAVESGARWPAADTMSRSCAVAGRAPAIATPTAVAIARIEAAGGRLLAEASEKPWGDTAAYFADPDGNVIAVATET